jgi:hypothetical protein
MEAAEVGTGLDDPMSYTRHLRGDGDVGHALAIGTERITPEISFELVAEAVLAQAYVPGRLSYGSSSLFEALLSGRRAK